MAWHTTPTPVIPYSADGRRRTLVGRKTACDSAGSTASKSALSKSTTADAPSAPLTATVSCVWRAEGSMGREKGQLHPRSQRLILHNKRHAP